MYIFTKNLLTLIPHLLIPSELKSKLYNCNSGSIFEMMTLTSLKDHYHCSYDGKEALSLNTQF